MEVRDELSGVCKHAHFSYMHEGKKFNQEAM